MTIEQAQILYDKLVTLNIAKAKGSDTAKLNRLKRNLKWALEEETDESKQQLIDQLDLNFMKEESLEMLVESTEDRELLAVFLVA